MASTDTGKIMKHLLELTQKIESHGSKTLIKYLDDEAQEDLSRQ
jgi:hypothetical protein